MLPSIKLQASYLPKTSFSTSFPNHRLVLDIKFNNTNCNTSLSQNQKKLESPLHLLPRFASLSTTTNTTTPCSLSSSVGTPPSSHLIQWNINHRHIYALNAIACSVAISAAWLFLSAIPTLLAFKGAAESLEKLLDVTREELPDTMAAIRLSGMEISDLTMELSDLGQEITQGVRNSTRAVRLAEDRLRRLTNMTPTALVQEQAAPKTKTTEPVIARTARSLRKGIVKGRVAFQILFTLTHFSRWAINVLVARKK